LGLALIAGGVATAVAIWPTWLPVAASREAGRIHFVIWFVVVICIAIFALVAAVMVYSVLRFRVQDDDFEDGPSVHGHTGLEITWTAIPFVLVTAIAIVSAIVLSRNDAQAENTLRVDVVAQQFEFTFSYPDAKNVTSPVLRLPEGRSVELYMRALDVIHSVFVPQFSQKEDIVPVLGGRALGLQQQRLLELPHAERRQRDGDGRARPRQARVVCEEGEAAADPVRPRLDRGSEQVHRARLPERRHAGDVRAITDEDAARRARRLPRPVRTEIR
jgi:heme/copper-type cytochrome/quinol oxidase subunit 2